MTLKQEIQGKFGSIKRFAEILGAPVATIHSWTREKKRHKPAGWQLNSFLESATYKADRKLGWKCKGCGAISEDAGAGIAPHNCGHCGIHNFNTVFVVDLEGERHE